MISDTIVVVITWYYTYAQYRNTHMLKVQASLTGMLLRDCTPLIHLERALSVTAGMGTGTMYFVIFLAMNILRISLNYLHVRSLCIF